jgi:Flp pilus assembly protein TadD
MLGLCRLRLDEKTEALTLLETAHTLAPADAYAQLHYGLGLHAVGRHDEAPASFSCAQRLRAAPRPT